VLRPSVEGLYPSSAAQCNVRTVRRVRPVAEFGLDNLKLGPNLNEVFRTSHLGTPEAQSRFAWTHLD